MKTCIIRALSLLPPPYNYLSLLPTFFCYSISSSPFPSIRYLLLLLACSLICSSPYFYLLGCSGKPLQYQLNGLRVLFLLIFLVLWLDFFSYFELEMVYDYFWEALGAAFLAGMLGSLTMFIKGRGIPKEKMVGRIDRPRGKA